MDTLLIYLPPILLTIVVAVWALMVIGAWVTITQFKPLLYIALPSNIAAPIVEQLRKGLVTIIIAIATLVAATYQSQSYSKTYETAVTTLICKVKGQDTPADILATMDAFADLPGKYRDTLSAYHAFLESEKAGNLNVAYIEGLLPKNKTIYDYRLLAVTHLRQAKFLHTSLKGKEPEKERKELLAGKSWNEKTRALLGEDLPGHPNAQAGADFKDAIRVNQAYVSLELGRLEDNEVEKLKFLNEAKNEYINLIVSRPSRAAPYCNLMASYSLLGDSASTQPEKSRLFEDALTVLDSVNPTAKDAVRMYILDLDKQMPELKPLREYAEKLYQKTWETIVRERLG
jgi:hypothetical protein